MSPFFKALLATAAIAQLSYVTLAQIEASVDVFMYAGLGCNNNLNPTGGPFVIELGIGSGVGTPLTVAAPPGVFEGAIVVSTSSIANLAFCEHGCDCSPSGCNTFTVPLGAIGTNECVTVDSLVDSNGNPLLPGTQWDKFSATIV